VDGLVTAFGLEVRDLTADVCVAASQFLTAVLRRSLEPGLNAAVRMMDQAGEVLSLASPEGQLECIERQFRMQ
jgi:hypothetical protein